MSRNKTSVPALPESLNPENRLLVGDIARETGFAVQTIHRWIISGKLEAGRVAGRYFVSKEAWQKFLDESNKARPTGKRELANIAS